MSFVLNVLFSLAFAGAVGGAFRYWRLQLESARRDGMQALAARRGWALTVTGERLGRAGTLRLAPRGGHPWVAEVRPRNGRPGGPLTEYESDEPRWPGGTLVLIPAQPEGLGEAEMPPASDPKRERPLRDLLGDELARGAANLDAVPSPEGMTALADSDPSMRVDLQDLGQVMKAWTAVAPGARGQPVLVLSPEGMRLRLRHPIKRPDQMERFLDLALDLTRLIGP